MKLSITHMSVLGLAALLLAGVAFTGQKNTEHGLPANEPAAGEEKPMLTVQYLEIVTPMVDETCEALSKAHGVEFGDPVPEFGNARTADLTDGGRIGVRGPMRASESPVVRPYLLVKDIDAAVNAAQEAGATMAMPPMPIPGQGTFSIYILGGIEHGLWQN